jgi:hypothetical protein
VLGLWQVPKPYANRDQWSGTSTPDYHRLITGPMAVLGADPALVAAVVRYVEVRCLLAGTTTSQGVTLSSAPGIVKHFRGLVRNVESTGTRHRHRRLLDPDRVFDMTAAIHSAVARRADQRLPQSRTDCRGKSNWTRDKELSPGDRCVVTRIAYGLTSPS